MYIASRLGDYGAIQKLIAEVEELKLIGREEILLPDLINSPFTGTDLTPLMLVCAEGHYDLAKAMIEEWGACTRAKDKVTNRIEGWISIILFDINFFFLAWRRGGQHSIFATDVLNTLEGCLCLIFSKMVAMINIRTI